MTDRMRASRPIVLSIAGSDPSGGAGIQADQATFRALGAYPLTVVTAVTVQSTRGVRAVESLPIRLVRAQLAELVADCRIDAVKIGMLGAARVLPEVLDVLDGLGPDVPIVLDPVLRSTSGAALVLDDGGPSAEAAILDALARLRLLTPNAAELARLAGAMRPSTEAVDERLALLHERGAQAVLVTGGDASGPDAVDLLSVRGHPLRSFSQPRSASTASHGTGCTLSSAIAVGLARREPLAAAIESAKRYVTGAIRAGDGFALGGGVDPLDHDWMRRD